MVPYIIIGFSLQPKTSIAKVLKPEFSFRPDFSVQFSYFHYFFTDRFGQVEQGLV